MVCSVRAPGLGDIPQDDGETDAARLARPPRFRRLLLAGLGRGSSSLVSSEIGVT